jgi:SAM-dependent methyltransferase
MVTNTYKPSDPYGAMLLEQMKTGEKLCEIIEREDSYIDTASEPGHYISEHKNWSSDERKAVSIAKGRVLDVGAGAGRHSLYLQEKGLDVTAIDNSPGAIRVCKARGVKKAIVRSIADISRFKAGSFDSILMLGNNFGLLRDPKSARRRLAEFDRITADNAVIIAGSLNPYGTKNKEHLRYHKFNRQRGRMPGQITFRVRFRSLIGEWFDYLLVSPEEMGQVLNGTIWKASRFVGNHNGNYFGIIRKLKL